MSVGELRGRVPTLVTFDELVDWAGQHERLPRIVLDLKEREIDRQIVPALADDHLRRRVIVTTQHTGSIRRLTTRRTCGSGSHADRLPPGEPRVAAAVDIPTVRCSSLLLPQLRWSRATAVVPYYRWRLRVVRSFHRAGRASSGPSMTSRRADRRDRRRPDRRTFLAPRLSRVFPITILSA
jgi:hypothetical protein